MRQRFPKIGPDLFLAPRPAHHVRRADVNQLIQLSIDKPPAFIALAAIALIQRAVFLAAEYIVLHRHAAALANQLPGRTQKRVDRYIKKC